MATRRKYIVFIQRGNKTYFHPVLDGDGSDRYDLDQLSQKYNLTILDSDLQNKIIVNADGTLVVKTGRPFNADLLLSDLQAQFPGEFDSSTVVVDPLANSTTTTTTSTTTTTTTTTHTTTTTTT